MRVLPKIHEVINFNNFLKYKKLTICLFYNRKSMKNGFPIKLDMPLMDLNTKD